MRAQTTAETRAVLKIAEHKTASLHLPYQNKKAQKRKAASESQKIANTKPKQKRAPLYP
jgi:hypothetical protein